MDNKPVIKNLLRMLRQYLVDVRMDEKQSRDVEATLAALTEEVDRSTIIAPKREYKNSCP